MTMRAADIGCRRSAFLAVVSIVLMGDVGRADDARDAVAVSRPLEAADVARMLPDKLAQLIVKAQDQIEIKAKLDAVLLADVQLEEADGERRRAVILTGKVRSVEQRALTARVVMDTLRSESFWNTMDDEFVVDASRLTLTEPSLDRATKDYGLAISEFFRGQYDKADRYFTHALAEDPANEALHYWKVAAAIALKQPERAERRLEVLCRRNPQGSRLYAAALQRLQGPLRQALVELEEQVTLRIREGTPRPRKGRND
jgi:tetratricopeptide (TPR) repeat protein